MINDASCRLRGAGHCPAGHLYGKLTVPTPAELGGPGHACGAPEPVVHLIPPAPTHPSTPFTCRPAPQEQMSHVSLAHAPRAEANSAGPRSFHWDRAEDAGAVSASDLSQYVVNPRVVWCGQWIESESGRRQDPSSRPPHRYPWKLAIWSSRPRPSPSDHHPCRFHRGSDVPTAGPSCT